MLRNVLPFLICCIVALSCGNAKDNQRSVKAKASVVNTAHLDHLYVPVSFANGKKAAGIYIYAEAPDYHHVADEDEGFTCVDDVARAAQVYLRSPAFTSDTAVQNKTISLIHFLLEMQSPNGYFYNFLFKNGSINVNGKTSLNNGNWWSWRALQTLTEAVPVIRAVNPPLGNKMDTAVQRLLRNIKADLISLPPAMKRVGGVDVPQYFPAGSASDQASILILSLINYCSDKRDDALKGYIRTLANGIVNMQHGDENKVPFGCFLSWENVWHAYGNDQAYALLRAGSFLADSGYINSALKELSSFYPWLIKNQMLSSFSIEKSGNGYRIKDTMQFAQIAYGMRPMISATIEAYKITGDKKFASIAQEITRWFFGRNSAREKMYDQQTGRCYDGIISKNKVNKNSGAESTIEALLALQLMEKYKLLDSTVTGFK